MRVAVTTGHLSIPPTYFVTQHAERLVPEHTIEAFPLVARVDDPSLKIPIRSALTQRAPWALARYLAPAMGTRQGRLVRAFAPDVVHQHFATWASHAVDAAAAVGAPAVVTLHGYDVFEAAHPRGGALGALHAGSIRAARDGAARTLAVSGHLAGLAVAAGWSADRLAVHYQGVETDYYAPDEGAAPDADETVVAFVGALSHGKGVLELARASIAVAAERPHRLRMAGTGPLRAQLEAASREHPHIELLGALDREGVRALLRSARVLSLPAKEHDGRREAAGLVLLEAQACGVPVLATASGGVPEMLRPDETGLLVPEADDRALAAGLDALLRLPDLEWRRLSAAAREFVVRERSVATAARALATHYADVSGR